MARRAKLTKSLIDGLKYDGDGSSAHIVWDEALPGFGVRVYPTSKKSFVLRYTLKGRKRTIALGAFSALTLQEARKLAQAKKVDVYKGDDPLEIRAAEKRASITVDNLADRYLAEHALPKKKPRSAEEDERNLKNHVRPAIGSRGVADVTAADAQRIHHAMRGRPYAANRVLALMSKMFNLAETWGLRPPNSNPCRALQKFKETRRDKFLSRAELQRLGDVLATAEEEGLAAASAVDAIRFLLFTGCRRNEALTLQWRDVDLDRGVASLRDAKSGPRPLQLSEPACALLALRKRIDGNPYVFTGHVEGGHLVNLRKPWMRIAERAELDGFRLHDLRHTFASYAVMSGLTLPALGRLLGHSQAQTTHGYSHWADEAERTAASTVGGVLGAALNASREPRVEDDDKIEGRTAG